MNIPEPIFYKSIKHYFLLVFVLLCTFSVWSQEPAQDSVKTGFSLGKLKAPNPKSVESKYTFDPITNRYIYTEKIGSYNIKHPVILTPEEYYALVAKENLKTYYKEKISAFDGKKEGSEDGQKNLIPEFYVKSDLFRSIFGSDTINVVPQGSVEMDLGILFSKQDNPSFSPRNRSNFTFDFDQRISLSLLGNVGTRLQVTANYDTQASYDFQDIIKLEFDPSIGGGEDSIIQKLEVGNVSMPLNSSLITGAQSLFGVKAQLQFGRTTVTGVFSEQKSQANRVVAQGGGTLEEFELFIWDYDENRHFFLAQYFRDTYNKALETYPYINNKGLQITRLEVWVTNRSNRTENVRNIVAFQDLGETDLIGLQTQPAGFVNAGMGAVPDNSNNDFDPTTIGASGLLTEAVREVATVQSGILVPNVNEGFDYAKLENARKLINGQEYDLNKDLGYISLNQRLNNDEVLAVAFQFTIGGKVFQVGEFANDGVNSTATGNDTDGDGIPDSIDADVNGDGTVDNGPDTDGDEINDTGDSDIDGDGIIDNGPDDNADGINDQFVTIQEGSTQNLVVKMLKSPITSVNQPVWKLMMKNIYETGAYNLSQEDFKLNIFYNEASPLNFITPVGTTAFPTPGPNEEPLNERPLLRVFSLDKLNYNNDPQAKGDGFFDFVPAITVLPQTGKIIFPSVEPFGEYLFDKLSISAAEDYNNDVTYNENQTKYVYDILYKSTKTAALEEVEKNKFKIKGRYKSAGGGGIPIPFGAARGSVTVTAGGRVLVEGVDYTVNYASARVEILDESLKASNTPIEVSTENNAVFGQQTRRFTGINVEHKFNENFVLGATLLNLNERPITQKANYGSESINNTIFGVNGNYSTKVPFLTRLVNKLPNIDTDVKSNLSVRGEFAYLAPGAPKRTNLNGEATSYVDDFEGSQGSIDLKSQQSWFLSSTPFDTSLGYVDVTSPTAASNLENGYQRALLNWYTIDPIFYSNRRPDGISDNDVSSLFTSRVFINELFPDRDIVPGQNSVLFTLDLAYYPSERGPYNFSPAANGNILPNPQDSWAGITRQLTSTDLEQANVEYIEFWLQDPFQESPTNPGGKLVFNLGNISEDVLSDGRKQYENGLPDTSNNATTSETTWGKTPTNQSLIYAFDNTGQDRILQDIGYDGLNDADEGAKFTAFSTLDDPANDNYSYFLDAEGDVFERYKKFNGVEGNTPDTFSDTQRASNTQPDAEDINRDNTMNTINSYFEYELDITRDNLPESEADFDNIPDSNPLKDFLRDFKSRPRALPNGDSKEVRWYQFRIPVQGSHVTSIGGINDLRSVRFARVFLKEFSENTVFRFGSLDLVRSDWRRYTKALDKNDATPDDPQTDFSVGVIGTLENEGSYQRPPGIDPEELFNNNTVIQQNEQSLVVNVCNLESEDAKAVYKNISIDMRQYKRIRMFMHAESDETRSTLANDELVGFIRMGNDLTENFYQIEIPLQVSTSTTREGLWPTANEINLPIDVLGQIKSLGISDGTLTNLDPTFYDVINGEAVPITGDEYSNYIAGQHRIAIKGNPNFGDIRTLMVGVKNASDSDDVCAEVWFNELRLSDLDNEGGWAAVLSLDTNIADFADISATGRRSTSGFGSIEQGPSQRSLEDVKQYDVVTNINVGQLLPKKWGVQLPFNYAQSEELITPKYDQFYKDLTLESRLDAANNAAEREEIKQNSEDYTKRQSINFIGVRKIRTGESEPRFYDVENLTLNYSYNKVEHRDFEIENSVNKTLRVGANYAFSFKPITIEPFKKNDSLFRGKYWKILKDFNFNLLPTSFTVNTDINRQFNKQKFRDIDLGGGNIGIEELFRRNYTFDFQYTINYNLTKSLSFNFTAANNNIVRNYFKDNIVNGEQDPTLDVWDGFLDFGDPNRQTQDLGITYQLPIDKIPVFNFLKTTYQYSGNFQWQKGSDLYGNLPLTITDPITGVETTNNYDLGNNIQNANTHNINSTLDMKKLYKSIGLVKKPIRNVKPKPSKGGSSTGDSKPQKSKNKSVTKLLNIGVDILTSIKRIQFNYSENNGTFLPGYTRSPGFIGTLKPTLGYTFGSQSDIRHLAARNGWLTVFPEFNQQYTETHTKQMDFSANLEPVKDLKIDFVGNRAYYENYNENYKVESGIYNSLTPNTFGNFNISTILIKTAFDKSDENISEAFNNFSTNRLKIADRLAEKFYGNSTYARDAEGYPLGFGKNNQAVLLPAFLAAYSGQDASKVKTSAFRNVPIPNWDFKYTGFMKIKWFKKRFKRFSLTHGYRSTYTINQFNTNLNLNLDTSANEAPISGLDYASQPSEALDQSGNYKNGTLFSNINLMEQFSPLVRLDFEMKNSIKILAEVKKDRLLSLSFDNNLLTEIQGNEYIIGLGYRIKDLRINTKLAGPKKRIVSDLNMKADISVRENKTIIRYLDLENNQITSGQTIWGLKYSADYAFSKNLTGIFYFDYNFSEYAISTAFPQTTIRSGLTLRYNFGN